MSIGVAAGSDGIAGPLEGLRDGEQRPDPISVVVIIPAFNEERFIASVVLTTRRYVNKVIVVDDGSSDRTAELAEAAGAYVVRQPTNGGKARALNAGFREAKAIGAHVVVCLDGDAQHEPAEIPRLAEPILNGDADVVIGSRFLDIRSRIPKWRQVGQHGLTVVTNVMSGVRVSDSQSGYRAFSPHAVGLLHFKSNGLSLESEMQFMFEALKLRVKEVPISVRYLDGNKRNPMIHGLQVIDSILGLVARRRPLLILSLPGVLLSCIGFVLGLYVSVRMNQTGTLMTGSAMVTVLLMIGGILLAMSGVLLHSMRHLIENLRSEIADLLEMHGTRA